MFYQVNQIDDKLNCPSCLKRFDEPLIRKQQLVLIDILILIFIILKKFYKYLAVKSYAAHASASSIAS